MPPSLLAYAFALCLGAKLKFAGTGPSSISLMRTQSAADSLASSVSSCDLPTYAGARQCSRCRTDIHNFNFEFKYLFTREHNHCWACLLSGAEITMFGRASAASAERTCAHSNSNTSSSITPEDRQLLARLHSGLADNTAGVRKCSRCRMD